MVPQHFVFLESMPQTNNGKIDYKSLPAPKAEVAETTDIAMPNSPAEKYLAGVWEEVLEIEDVGLNDTFFDIGGHSLLVMKIITEVNEKTGVKLGPQEFLISTLDSLQTNLVIQVLLMRLPLIRAPPPIQHQTLVAPRHRLLMSQPSRSPNNNQQLSRQSHPKPMAS